MKKEMIAAVETMEIIGAVIQSVSNIAFTIMINFWALYYVGYYVNCIA